MRWLICGTVPDPGFELTLGEASIELQAGRALRPGPDATRQSEGAGENRLVIAPAPESPFKEPVSVPINRGTTALAAAAAIAASELGGPAPLVLMAGDSGKGLGSGQVYAYLQRHAAEFAGWGITFHYLLPDVDWHNRLLMALDELKPRPLLCADAGFMYAAKMSGYAGHYDLFTPDLGELAFLADEKAPHPFYTRGFLLAEEHDAAALAARAHEHGNSAKTLLIKGHADLIAAEGKILERVDYPMIPNLEPVGGTGDTVAGVASGLMSVGYPLLGACKLAALANRFMGQLAQPTPATQIAELLAQLPGALQLALQEN